MRINLILLIIFGTLAQLAQAQEILCVESQNNDVLLSWNPPVLPCGPFVSYEVWVSNDPSTAFALITTVINAAQTSFTHINAFNIGEKSAFVPSSVPPSVGTSITRNGSSWK
mgnify:CR=1 FL=1